MQPGMNERRPQDLIEAFASIIKMMLVSIRAQGWRSLRHLPTLLLVAIELRRVGKEFAAIMAAFRAGTLPPLPPAPAPAPWTDPPDRQALCAGSPAAPRPAARPDPAARDRQQPAELPSPPAADAAPDLPRAAAGARSAAALPHARARAAVWPPRHTPGAFAVLGLRAGVIASGRSP